MQQNLCSVIGTTVMFNSAGVVQTLLLLLPHLTVHELNPTHVRILTVFDMTLVTQCEYYSHDDQNHSRFE